MQGKQGATMFLFVGHNTWQRSTVLHISHIHDSREWSEVFVSLTLSSHDDHGSTIIVSSYTFALYSWKIVKSKDVACVICHSHYLNPMANTAWWDCHATSNLTNPFGGQQFIIVG